jgi:uncharacterized alkaline shock family protein YloU
MPDEKNDIGNIKISDEAIASIASIAAKQVDGVIDMDGGPVGTLAETLGVKNELKGIKIDMGKESVSVEINLIVAFGSDVSEIATAVQEKIKEAIENMTGLSVEKINVNINRVKIP